MEKEVFIGKKGLQETYQGDFLEITKCHQCNGTARIAFVFVEDPTRKKNIKDLHLNEGPGGFWLHDCCSVAIYFCRDCFEAVTIWNQA